MKVNTGFHHFDPETLAGKYGPEMTLQVAKIYLEESPQLVRRFQNSLQRQPYDYQRIGKSAHTLKGSLGMMGAHHLSDLARHLQEACYKKAEEGVRECGRALQSGLRSLHGEVERFVANQS